MKKPEVSAGCLQENMREAMARNGGLHEMDTYYKSELPTEEECLDIVVQHASEIYSGCDGYLIIPNKNIQLLGKAISARLKQVIDPQPPNQEEGQ